MFRKSYEYPELQGNTDEVNEAYDNWSKKQKYKGGQDETTTSGKGSARPGRNRGNDGTGFGFYLNENDMGGDLIDVGVTASRDKTKPSESHDAWKRRMEKKKKGIPKMKESKRNTESMKKVAYFLQALPGIQSSWVPCPHFVMKKAKLNDCQTCPFFVAGNQSERVCMKKKAGIRDTIDKTIKRINTPTNYTEKKIEELPQSIDQDQKIKPKEKYTLDRLKNESDSFNRYAIGAQLWVYDCKKCGEVILERSDLVGYGQEYGCKCPHCRTPIPFGTIFSPYSLSAYVDY